MNKIDLNTITFEQIVKILGIFNKMLESGILQVDLEKSTAYFNIDDCLTYLEQQIKGLKQKNEKLKEIIDKVNVFLNNHDKNAGKLYYKHNNKYLLSEIKEDIRNILKEVLE